MWSLPFLSTTVSGRELRDYYVEVTSAPVVDTLHAVAPEAAHASADALPCWGYVVGVVMAVAMTLVVYKLFRGKRKGRHLYRTVPLAQLVSVCEAGEGAIDDYVLIEV
ncbi:hypothetical protein ACHHYP_16655 [Achlya hypogyna]|uniref:Uncharacterized protein n=1 Tax=Achlya hypogyna TaxID=1202772 RepID=A0A1V9Y652_ACHHY|nr:hypothetical protein ACHHYP_16655 [Achlya hypogyna]